jgi:hypothetical protein
MKIAIIYFFITFFSTKDLRKRFSKKKKNIDDPPGIFLI